MDLERARRTLELIGMNQNPNADNSMRCADANAPTHKIGFRERNLMMNVNSIWSGFGKIPRSLLSFSSHSFAHRFWNSGVSSRLGNLVIIFFFRQRDHFWIYSSRSSFLRDVDMGPFLSRLSVSNIFSTFSRFRFCDSWNSQYGR